MNPQRRELIWNEAWNTFGRDQFAFIKTYGCQDNWRDSETIKAILIKMGYTMTDDPAIADFCLLNTCAVRENAETKMFGKLGELSKLRQQKPNMIFAVCGCMAQEPTIVERLKKSYNYVDLVFGTQQIQELPTLLHQLQYEQYTLVSTHKHNKYIYENMPQYHEMKHKAFVAIMKGCNNYCSYCIVPYTRGIQMSRQSADIINEIETLVKDGCQEITLLGQNVNAWGIDLVPANKFSNLLTSVAKTNMARIRFITSNPWNFSEDIVDVMHQFKNIMPHVHLPVQSGNDVVLHRMRRQTKISSYLQLVKTLRAKIPNLALTTDLIVGFPGETTEQFNDTLELYRQCAYDLAYIFIFSARPGTPAAKLPEQIPYPEQLERFNKLNDLVKYYANQNNTLYQGQVVVVLVDGVSKNNPDLLTGYTPQNKLVHFHGANDLVGKMVEVKITTTHIFYFHGELINAIPKQSN